MWSSANPDFGYNPKRMPTPVATKSEVFQILTANKARLRALGIQRVGVFGSFRHDTAGPESDVDLLVEFAPEGKTFLNWMDAYDLVEEVLGRKVDLVTPRSLSQYCAPRILAEAEYVPLTD